MDKFDIFLNIYKKFVISSLGGATLKRCAQPGPRLSASPFQQHKSKVRLPFQAPDLILRGACRSRPLFQLFVTVVYASQRFLSSSSAAPPQRVRPARVYIQVPQPPVEGSS